MSKMRNDPDVIWEIVLQRLQRRISPPMFDMWIAPLSWEIRENKTIIVKAASEFAKDWVIENYKHEFTEVLKELTGQNVEIKVVYINEQEVNIKRANSKNRNGKSEGKRPTKKANVTIPIITEHHSSRKIREVNARITNSIEEVRVFNRYSSIKY